MAIYTSHKCLCSLYRAQLCDTTILSQSVEEFYALGIDQTSSFSKRVVTRKVTFETWIP